MRFWARWCRGGKAAIINVALVVAFQPFPHFAVYAASKAFVLSFSEALAEELKGSGVRILALCPGAASADSLQFRVPMLQVTLGICRN